MSSKTKKIKYISLEEDLQRPRKKVLRTIGATAKKVASWRDLVDND